MTQITNYKKLFPVFKTNPSLVYLDSAATSLKPQCVIDAVSDYYSTYSANVHRGLYELSEKATEEYENSRKKIRDFVNAKSEKEIIFTSGTTAAINIVARSWGDQNLKSGDEIILSILEHHSNIVPWQMMAKKKNCSLKYIDIDSRGLLKTNQLSDLLTRRTKLISISHVSNALGTVVDLKPIIQKAHAVGAKVLVDGAQSVPHLPIDVQHLDCDFLAFSGHKMCGPTGIGVLYAKEKLLKEMEPFFGGGDMILEVSKERFRPNELPWKFEAGTPPIASAIGLGEAVSFLQEKGMQAVRSHEKKLVTFALEKLKNIKDMEIYGPRDSKLQSGIISFNIKGVHPHDAASLLDNHKIAIRAGHHCCMPLMDRMKITATCRASFYIYNDEKDIEKLVEGIKKVKKIFNL